MPFPLHQNVRYQLINLEVSESSAIAPPSLQKIEDIKVKALHISCKKRKKKRSATMNGMIFYICLIEACSKYGIIYLHLPIKINHSCRYIYIYIIHGTSG